MIDYNNGDNVFLEDATTKDLLITDGTVTVSGTNYSVAGATVTITNDLIEQEAFELKQNLCSNTQIQFGSCEAAQISFTIHENIPTVKGKVLKVYLIPDHDASKMLQIGVFKVYEDKLSADRTKRSITAYDAIYDILNSDVAAWYNTLLPNSSSSVTLLQFRNSFFSHFGITQESASLVNDSITIKRTIEPESLSGGDVIKAICEINGCFGHITNTGNFKYVILNADLDAGVFPSDILYPADNLYPQDINPNITEVPKSLYTDVQFEDYLSESITQLTLRTTDDDAGVTVGTAGNRYVITGNFLVYGYNTTQLTAVANGVLGNIVKRYYKPCTVNCLGNPCHEVGDGIRIRTKYRGIVAYILERSLKGIQALRDTYSAQGTEYCDQQLNSVGSQFKQLSGKVASLKVDTDGIAADVSDLDTREASHYRQTSSEISLKVSKSNLVEDLDDEMDSSSISISSNKINFKSSGTLIVNTTNFTLDQYGNASFSGDISGSTISAQGHLEIYEDAYTNSIWRIDSIQFKDGGETSSMSSSGASWAYGGSRVSISGESGITLYKNNTPVIRIDIDDTPNIYINGNRVLTEADLPISGGSE